MDGSLDRLADIILDDADRLCLHAEDTALAEARAIEADTHTRLEELESAAREIGRTRGQAADRAREAEADREIRGVYEGAADALWSRFSRQLRMALDALPQGPDYLRALDAWAAHAAEAIDRPVEVFAARRDRAAVYDALLSSGAKDFQVQVEHRHTVGFVVRDLDSRTVYDCRPDALLGAHDAALQELLLSQVPAFEAPAA